MLQSLWERQQPGELQVEVQVEVEDSHTLATESTVVVAVGEGNTAEVSLDSAEDHIDSLANTLSKAGRWPSPVFAAWLE